MRPRSTSATPTSCTYQRLGDARHRPSMTTPKSGWTASLRGMRPERRLDYRPVERREPAHHRSQRSARSEDSARRLRKQWTLSNPATNFIWMRYACLAFFRAEPGPVSITPSEVNVEVIRHDPAIDKIIGPNPKLYKLAEGFQFTEGPVWIRDGGYLLFSDPNASTIYKYSSDGALTVFRQPSGYSGSDIAEYRQPGSNGLTLDRQGRLTVNEHGNRSVTRTERDGSINVLADRFEGKRLNSPQRSRVPLGRNALLHRPELRAAQVRRRRAKRTAVHRSFPAAQWQVDAGEQRVNGSERTRVFDG